MFLCLFVLFNLQCLGSLSADWKVVVPLNCRFPRGEVGPKCPVKVSWLGGTTPVILVDRAGILAPWRAVPCPIVCFRGVNGLGMALGQPLEPLYFKDGRDTRNLKQGFSVIHWQCKILQQGRSQPSNTLCMLQTAFRTTKTHLKNVIKPADTFSEKTKLHLITPPFYSIINMSLWVSKEL